MLLAFFVHFTSSLQLVPVPRFDSFRQIRKINLIILLSFIAQGAGATDMLRFACSQPVTERLDPVVDAGKSPSQHMHQIVGGDAFNVSMSANVAEEASCTTCTFNEDFSNYWTQVMYFRARNGAFKRVSQIANQYLEGANVGMTVYYMSPDDTSVNITAFKPGFRMVVGDPTARTAAQGYTNFDPNPIGVSANDTYDFPTQYCAGGVRVATFFPICWDGVNLDRADHKSHVSYATGSDGGCSGTHPVQIPQIMLENVWDTSGFPQSEWPEDGSQPFVWSQGDPTGYGGHADYVFGWKGVSLQSAMDARCNLNDCSELSTQSYTAANSCLKNRTVVEPDGANEWLTELPGNMTITT